MNLLMVVWRFERWDVTKTQRPFVILNFIVYNFKQSYFFNRAFFIRSRACLVFVWKIENLKIQINLFADHFYTISLIFHFPPMLCPIKSLLEIWFQWRIERREDHSWFSVYILNSFQQGFFFCIYSLSSFLKMWEI